MSCENVQKRISLLLDCKLPAGEREHVLAHLDACGQCGERFESMQNMRASLRDMAQPRVPVALSIKLRILASHERARWIARQNLSTRLAHWVTATQLAFDNMMRPFAVPVTGGVVSALVLFSLLVPSLSFPHSHSYEPPLAVAETDVQWGNPDGKLLGATADHARLLPGSALIDGNEVSLTLLIDEREVQLHAGEEADGGGPEELHARSSERHAIGFEGQADEIAVDGFGGDGDFVIDFVGRSGGGSRRVAFGQAQAGARRHFGGRVRGGNRISAPDHQAVEVVEEGRRVRSLNGDADAHARARLCPGGDAKARAHVRLVPIEVGGMARGQERAPGGRAPSGTQRLRARTRGK